MNQIAIYLNYLLFLLRKQLKAAIQIVLFILQPIFSLLKVIFAFVPSKFDNENSIVFSKINKCQDMLDKYLEMQNTSRKIQIVWKQSNKIPNAHAATYGKIVLTGDWSFLKDDCIIVNGISYRTIDYLYTIVGHELGHKDSEPFSNLFSNIQNYIREVRADFCGINFAVFCNVDRQLAIETKYYLSEFFENKYGDDKHDSVNDRINDYLDGHPSNKARKEYLESSNNFSKDVIYSIVIDFYKGKAESFCNTQLYEVIIKKALSFNIFYNS